MLNDAELAKYGYVISSSYRKKTILALENKLIIPTTISKLTGIRTNHISKVLSELKSIGLIICINEDARKGRLYRLTGEGERILEVLKDECR